MALPLPADTLKAWEHPASAAAEGLALPQRNHFIPTDFSLRASSEAAGSKDGAAREAAEAILTAVPEAGKVGPCVEFRCQ